LFGAILNSTHDHIHSYARSVSMHNSQGDKQIKVMSNVMNLPLHVCLCRMLARNYWWYACQGPFC